MNDPLILVSLSVEEARILLSLRKAKLNPPQPERRVPFPYGFQRGRPLTSVLENDDVIGAPFDIRCSEYGLAEERVFRRLKAVGVLAANEDCYIDRTKPHGGYGVQTALHICDDCSHKGDNPTYLTECH